MYSSGIPILYPFSFVFFTVNYWMFKWLLLKYYRTTTEFNEHLAVNSIQWMQIGFVLHAVTTLMMYSNQDTMNYMVNDEDTNQTEEQDSSLQNDPKGFFQRNYQLDSLKTRLFSNELVVKLLLFYAFMLIFYVVYRIIKLISII